MIVPDINLLIYAYDAASPFHRKAAKWWEACLSETVTVGIPWLVILGFVRIATNARSFADPLTIEEAVTSVA